MFACFEFIQVSFQTMFTANRNIFCRVAVMYFFMLEGLLAGVFASQLPSIQVRRTLVSIGGDIGINFGFCLNRMMVTFLTQHLVTVKIALK